MHILKKNIWLEKFECADEQGKLDLIWEIAHLATVNSANRHALHVMLRWLADYTLENVPIEEGADIAEQPEDANESGHM